MSLLDNGPHTVGVIPRKSVDDGYGSFTLVDLPQVDVQGSCQPQSATEQEAMGLQGMVTYSFITRGPWPWNMVSHIIWEGPDGQWPGRKWDQEGEAMVYGMGRRTQHVQVTLKARTSEGTHGSSV